MPWSIFIAQGWSILGAHQHTQEAELLAKADAAVSIWFENSDPEVTQDLEIVEDSLRISYERPAPLSCDQTHIIVSIYLGGRIVESLGNPVLADGMQNLCPRMRSLAGVCNPRNEEGEAELSFMVSGDELTGDNATCTASLDFPVDSWIRLKEKVDGLHVYWKYTIMAKLGPPSASPRQLP